MFVFEDFFAFLSLLLLHTLSLAFSPLPPAGQPQGDQKSHIVIAVRSSPSLSPFLLPAAVRYFFISSRAYREPLSCFAAPACIHYTLPLFVSTLFFFYIYMLFLIVPYLTCTASVLLRRSEGQR